MTLTNTKTGEIQLSFKFTPPEVLVKISIVNDSGKLEILRNGKLQIGCIIFIRTFDEFSLYLVGV